MVNKIMPLFILIFIKSSRSLHYKFSTLPLNRDENWDVTFASAVGGEHLPYNKPESLTPNPNLVGISQELEKKGMMWVING